ncbi:MAG: Addiction module toxin, RelE/StbE family [Parcubacteria group bacterium GW2011_GWA1_44_13]|uniref:Addiction module toxin, RelE/StbE family n=1 Tax=Candidatus Nomurabacteria bacterium GW2011_GWB1_44_12 TaxID=1618748 RepID=A0A837IAZ1_9BACT|nr:MAG: Addiction module toxin, RelE/StbE family [Candidatus Nomurabacteria bacterium GW2011_GWD1_44_10]KKT37160.1 MAG: Addiction module toxin, RelE/StbE family [Candidatus Nomurabacteria bacterium GW2011_GWB1_44_12]KKT38455.1 MAG: Addiction module toxin, RelE/StbE family [Parcubacteria group bacterium GW2011_GWA1_44_13]KKT60666.1 MAG: addiction module antitoxin [Parcubacteria group bacterium GW2011_GWC1_44_26]
MKYDFKGNSIKEFSKLPRKAQFQIMEKLELYMSASNPLSFAEHLTDFEFGEYRFRIGDYRVVFDVENDVAKILKVGHRKDIYK